MGRHMRRMRELYADVLQTLRSETEKYLKRYWKSPILKLASIPQGFFATECRLGNQFRAIFR